MNTYINIYLTLISGGDAAKLVYRILFGDVFTELHKRIAKFNVVVSGYKNLYLIYIFTK